jgi:hypothetical protein
LFWKTGLWLKGLRPLCGDCHMTQTSCGKCSRIYVMRRNWPYSMWPRLEGVAVGPCESGSIPDLDHCDDVKYHISSHWKPANTSNYICTDLQAYTVLSYTGSFSCKHDKFTNYPQIWIHHLLGNLIRNRFFTGLGF